MTISRDLKIEIRPIPGKNGIKKFSENLEYFSQAHTVPPLVDPVTFKYATGLSKDDLEYLAENNFPHDITDNYVRGVAHPFWESSMVKTDLKNSPMFLNPGKNLMDFIKYKYLLVSQYVYSSEEEMRTGVKTEATHYIFDEGVSTIIKATKIEKRNALIKKVSGLSLKRKRDIIMIIFNENTENKDENYLTLRFEDINSDKEQVFQLETLLENSAEELSLAADVKLAIQKNVLRRTKQGIFFFETNLGFSEEDVKLFLSEDTNQELFLNIKGKIK
jgi:hypothetical protein